ncbi:MAG: shikimate dehydrogenase [Pedobacter sp.]|nr:MAG: shikimate dehydrogenase [Pedobacter sp.]
MRSFGLIGYPLTHSFSKKYFTEKFEREAIADATYALFSIEEIGMLESLLKDHPDLRGLNVTIPHKIGVLSYLTQIDAAAAAIGAVNCLKIDRASQQIKGFNTDAYGFEESLKPFLEAHHQKALVFGDGGAAQAVKYVLNKLNIPFLSIVRKQQNGAINYTDVDEVLLAEYTVLINTTPLGTFPAVDVCPEIPYPYLTDAHLAYDLIYNPEETMFLRQARLQGAQTKNGLEMLILQAEKSWEIWNS